MMLASDPEKYKSYHSNTVPSDEARTTKRSSFVIPPLRTSPAVAAIAIVRTPRNHVAGSSSCAGRTRPRGCADGNIVVKSRPVRLSARWGRCMYEKMDGRRAARVGLRDLLLRCTSGGINRYFAWGGWRPCVRSQAAGQTKSKTATPALLHRNPLQAKDDCHPPRDRRRPSAVPRRLASGGGERRDIGKNRRGRQF